MSFWFANFCFLGYKGNMSSEYDFVPIVQRIERSLAEAMIEVRFLVGTLKQSNTNKSIALF